MNISQKQALKFLYVWLIFYADWWYYNYRNKETSQTERTNNMKKLRVYFENDNDYRVIEDESKEKAMELADISDTGRGEQSMKLSEVLNVIVNTEVCLIVAACGFVYTEEDRNEIESYKDCKVLTIETTLSGKLMITVRAERMLQDLR